MRLLRMKLSIQDFVLVGIGMLGVGCTLPVQAGAPAPSGTAAPHQSLALTHGVAAGDVTSDSAVIWARTDGDGFMHVRLKGPKGSIRTIPVSAEDDFTGQIRFECGIIPQPAIG